MSIERLNNEYGIAGQVTFEQGEGGFPFIRVQNDKASALVSVYGGQVLSFHPRTARDDLLFLSNRAFYAVGKSIKGGVPVCWPWFGPDLEGRGRPAHGFARNHMWEVAEILATPDGDTRIVLRFTDTEETRAIWQWPFDLKLEIGISETLSLDLVTQNVGAQAFTITQALHTYFAVGDISQTQITGLDTMLYIDKADDNLEKCQVGAVTIEAEVDRIYQTASSEMVIHDAAWQRRIRITSKGNRTAVIWNPWAKISAEMADLQDDAYQRFVCVETTNSATDRVHIQPGSEFRLAANYSIEQD